MRQTDEKENTKEPIDMTTDEAIEHVFGSEIAECLRREAGKNSDLADEPETDD